MAVLAGAGHHELVQDDPVRVEPGSLHPRTDQHQAPAPDELSQAGLHGPGIAGALEHHVHGIAHDLARLRDARHQEGVGVEHARRAHGRGQRPPTLVRLGAADVVHAQRPQHRDAQRADGPGTEHQHPLTGPDLPLLHGVHRDRQRLGQRGRPRVDAVRDGQQLTGARALVGGERALAEPHARRLAIGAERRAAGEAHRARPAALRGTADHRVARSPARDLIADRGHVAHPLVALPAPRRGPALEDHVEVAAADAAQVDGDENILWSEVRHGHLRDLEPGAAAQDRGGHHVRQIPHRGRA